MIKVKSVTCYAGICVSLAVLSGCAGPVTKPAAIDQAALKQEAEKQQEIVLQEQLKTLGRLQRVALPILRAATPLCKEQVAWRIGAWFATKDDFPKERQVAAANLLKMDDKVRVRMVADGSPAAVAGLMAGDEIVSVNARTPPTSGRIVEGFTNMLNEELKTGSQIKFIVNRAGSGRDIAISPERLCAYPANLVENDEVNAFADGSSININAGMMRFAADDRDLAVVIGHELSHNVMGHVTKKKVNAAVGLVVDILIAAATGINDQGAFSNAGAAAYSQEFEAEADYVGLYAVALANIDIDSAPNFWRKMAAINSGSIQKSYNASHPSTPERFLHMEQTVAEIKSKRSQGLALTPEFKPSTPTSSTTTPTGIGFAPH